MRPLSWQTGTEIGGLDLTRSDAIPEPVISALWRLVCERGILLFRDQFLTHDQHLDFTRRFGPLAESGFLSRYAPESWEKHTSELQSLMSTSYAGFCLTKKKIQNQKFLHTNAPDLPQP